MKDSWASKFWDDNGQRLIYMAIAATMGFLFVLVAPDMAGEGKTILIGVATFALTRMRGGEAPK